ncbi:MAG: hypothetical protein R6U28_10725 [Cyclonatronaceae bacterium]
MIKRALTFVLLFACSLMLVAGCGRSDPDREANRLFVEAYRLTEEAREHEKTDPSISYRNYTQAVENIDNIIANYPDTQLAVDVSQYRTRIGDITIGELRNKVRLYESKTKALQSFHDLTQFLIERENDEMKRAQMRLEYAERLHASGQTERYDAMIDEIIQQAERHWDRSLIDRLYHDLSVHNVTVDRQEAALEMADRIQDAERLYASLDSLVSAGFIVEGDTRSLERISRYLPYLEPLQRLKLTALICEELLKAGRGSQAQALIMNGLPQPDEQRPLEHIEELSSMSSIFADHAEYEISKQIIDQISDIDSNYVDFALRDLALAKVRNNRPGDAMEIIGDFDRDYFRQTTLAMIAIQYARSDSLDLALHQLERISESVSEKTESLLEVARYAVSDETLADSLLERALAGIGHIESPQRASRAYLRVADIRLLQNRRSRAAEALEQAESHAHDVSSTDILNALITDITKKWIQIGRPDRALDLAAWYQMDDSSFESHAIGLFSFAINRGYHDFARSLAGLSEQRSYYLFLLTSVYLENGLISQPAELAYEIRNYFWRTRALAMLVSDLKSKVNLAAAEKAAADALLTLKRIRESEQRQQGLYHVASLLSSAGIAMNEERKSLITELIGEISL